jgi:CheY-like chemotaxis protein
MKKILIIDENMSGRKMVSQLVNTFDNINIFEARNTKEALNIANTQNVDIVFMDVSASISNAIDMTRLIVDINPQTMVVAVSTHGENEHKRQIIQAGAIDYIRKPIHPEVFTSKIKNYLSIVENRRLELCSNKPFNLFSKDIFNRYLMFRGDEQSSLNEFWAYFLIEKEYKFENIKECICAVYEIAVMATKLEKTPLIITEENSECIYFTIKHAGALNQNTVRQIIKQNKYCGDCMLTDDKLSFKIVKN